MGTIRVSEDSTVTVGAGAMFRSAADGSLRAGVRGVGGLFVGDTRLLSTFDLTANSSTLEVASTRPGDGERSIVLLPAVPRNAMGDFVLTRRQRLTSIGLEESIEVRNITARPVDVVLGLECATDFADQFMLRSDKRVFDRSDAHRSVEVTEAGLRLGYQRGVDGKDFSATVQIMVTGEPTVTASDGDILGGHFSWKMSLAPGERRQIEVSARSVGAPAAVVSPLPLRQLAGEQSDALREQSLRDIQALRMPCPSLPHLTVLAAGVPWFLTLFGRDSIIASMLSEPDLPGLLDDTLRALAATQATETDDRRIAQPGKIVHELRQSELAQLDEIPYGRYYGSVDSTPLFLIGLAACSTREVIVDLESAARAAVDWMLGAGGITEFGFLRYIPDPNGLIHQGWKDSHDAVAHADGTIATGAIALCEVQGYAWRALMNTAALAREVWSDPDWAARLEAIALELAARFRREFWVPELDFPALAIDGSGRRVDVVASNAGHLLFSGMLDQADAVRVGERLLEPDMFTGFGLRTLSSGARLYHPMSYHNGSVWPHDTMVTAVGMKAYGMDDAALALASGIASAAAAFDNRLPELFGGFSRADFDLPVGYAHAATPQAWAAASGAAASRLLRELTR
jgi:glycogen debranching enzyme